MPRKNNINSKQGFTIIEVVLVLAVAGLIFLMVFIALPSLQRTQRDTQRRQDMSRLSAALVQYQTNNSNKANNLPSAGSCLPGDEVDFGATSTPSGGGAAAAVYNDTSACKFIKNYLNSATATENAFLDPDGAPYQLAITGNLASDSSISTVTIDGTTLTYADGSPKTFTLSAFDFSDHAIFVVTGGKCSNNPDGENVVEEAQRRQYAVIMKLEGSGFACLDNQ